jgi:pyruvate dehydrogenase (quinone)
MNKMAELITVAKYWRKWTDSCWVMCVFNNEDLNQVTWEQRVIEGDPKFDASQNIPSVPYHRFAEMIGLKGIYVDDPDRVGSAWDEALTAKRPVVLEVKTDPHVPPLPPHITLDHAKKFSQSLTKGDSRAGEMVAGAARQLLSAVLPERRD